MASSKPGELDEDHKNINETKNDVDVEQAARQVMLRTHQMIAQTPRPVLLRNAPTTLMIHITMSRMVAYLTPLVTSQQKKFWRRGILLRIFSKISTILPWRRLRQMASRSLSRVS